ncbi:thioredoxin family protein [Nocardioides taihuensis]|uniref:Thioredoxin family protein n=1 Tax=Nocardioides taihuensis TaxID=1835606 RepID=A0ABW0BEK4_9ACTN
MTAGAWVLLAAVVGALAFGAWRAYADGRFRGTHAVKGSGVTSTSSTDDSSPSVEPVETTAPLDLPAGTPLGERATLLQFSSAFCAPCRATRRVLADVAGSVPGVEHVEIDAEHHLDVVRRLGILRTPTTLVLDARGVEVARAAGAPSRQQVLAALDGVLP